MDGRDADSILTPEVKARMEKLDQRTRMFLEAYAETCSDPNDFMLSLQMAERKASGESMEEAVMAELIERGVIEVSYDRDCLITMYGESPLSEGRPICKVSLTNRAGACEITATVSINDGEYAFTDTIPAKAAGDTVSVIRIPESMAKALKGDEARIAIVVRDPSEIVLGSACGTVSLQERKRAEAKVSVSCRDVSIAPSETGADIADIDVSGEVSGIYTIILDDGTVERPYGSIRQSGRRTVRYDRVPGQTGTVHIKVSVVCNGDTVASGGCAVTIVPEPEAVPQPESEPEKVPPSADVPPVFINPAEPLKAVAKPFERRIDYAPTVDVNELDESGNIKVCTVAIKGKEARDQVTVNALLSGNTVFNDSVDVGRDWNEADIKVAGRTLSREDSHSEDLAVTVYDSNGSVVVCKNLGIMFRSKYDLYNVKYVDGTIDELTKTRWAQFVNPLLPDVHDFVADKNGPLAKEMGASYKVTGYQDASAIVRQMKAVFNAVRDLGMSYASVTSTLRESGSYFQSVRWPDKVMKAKSANCAEFSVLFASILEAMGLETILAFPMGHAVLGVVVGTDLYRSDSKRPEGAKITRFMSDGKYIDAIMFESTYAGQPHSSFEGAVNSVAELMAEPFREKGADTGMTVLGWINKGKRFVPVEEYRLKGINPLV